MRLIPRRSIGLSHWDVWSVPRRALVVIFAVELLAAFAVWRSLQQGLADVRGGWQVTAALLVVAGVVSTEASLGVERMRLRPEASPHIDLSSVWALAAAALLPALLATAMVMVIYVHIYVRVWRRTPTPPHRVLFSMSTIVLAVQAAAGVIHGLSGHEPFYSGAIGIAAVVLAVFTYAAVNMFLVVGVIVLSGPNRDLSTFLHVLRSGDEAVLEFATLSMGALVAGAMSSFGPAYAVLVLPPLVVLHRTVLVRQLEEAASTDSKTGLLNAAGWHVHAGRELRRAERVQSHATVLLLDLDHFKAVNDKHGHLVGDLVLAKVADTVRAEVRDDDIVGRFGGEEFVVLLRGVDGDDHASAEAVAERIRRRVAELRIEVPGQHGVVTVDDLTVSIGGATFPHDGHDLGPLLEVADSAMYTAKNTGRNRVQMGWRAAGERRTG